MKKTIVEILNEIHDINVHLMTDKSNMQKAMQDNMEVIMGEQKSKHGEADKAGFVMKETSERENRTVKETEKEDVSLEQARGDLIKDWILGEDKEPHYSENMVANLIYLSIRDIVIPDLEYLRSTTVSAGYPKDSAESDVI